MNPIQRAVFDQQLLNTGLPPKWYGKHVDGIEVKPMFLNGPVGTGKTHYMSAMLHQQWEDTLCNKDDWPIIKWVSAPNLLLRLRASYGQGAQETEEKIIKTYTQLDWLYLDDLGADKPSDWVRASLYLIIDTLYQSGMSLVVSSNLKLSELADVYDDRLASRIMEMCEVKMFTGHDRRGRK